MGEFHGFPYLSCMGQIGQLYQYLSCVESFVNLLVAAGHCIEHLAVHAMMLKNDLWRALFLCDANAKKPASDFVERLNLWISAGRTTGVFVAGGATREFSKLCLGVDRIVLPVPVATTNVEVVELHFLCPISKVVASSCKCVVRVIVVLTLSAIGPNDRSRTNQNAKVGIAFQDSSL